MSSNLLSVLFVSFLKNSEKLRAALRQALSLAFAQDVVADLLEALALALPCGATLSRWRLQFEAASCLFQRQDVAEAFARASEGLTFHVLIDSSPQGGRDWLLTEVHMLGHKLQLPDALNNLWRTCALCAEIEGLGVEDVSDQRLDELEELEDALQDAFRVLLLTPAGLGHQRSNAPQVPSIHSQFVCLRWKPLCHKSPVLCPLLQLILGLGGLDMCAPAHVLCPDLFAQALDGNDACAEEDPLPDIDLMPSKSPVAITFSTTCARTSVRPYRTSVSTRPTLQAMALFLCDKPSASVKGLPGSTMHCLTIFLLDSSTGDGRVCPSLLQP